MHVDHYTAKPGHKSVPTTKKCLNQLQRATDQGGDGLSLNTPILHTNC